MNFKRTYDGLKNNAGLAVGGLAIAALSVNPNPAYADDRAREVMRGLFDDPRIERIYQIDSTFNEGAYSSKLKEEKDSLMKVIGNEYGTQNLDTLNLIVYGDPVPETSANKKDDRLPITALTLGAGLFIMAILYLSGRRRN